MNEKKSNSLVKIREISVKKTLKTGIGGFLSQAESTEMRSLPVR
jgi:hypothetical protein